MSNYLDCANKILTPEQLISALLTKNSAGEGAIRVMLTNVLKTLLIVQTVRFLYKLI